MGMEQRDRVIECFFLANRKGRTMSKTKSFDVISREEVWEAYLKVKANKGAAGIDEVSLQEFEKDLKRNLYRIWNRMTSGSYFPPNVRIVAIPKSNGSERRLGIPTVADRIAQTVVKRKLEPLVEPHLHQDSYGYRPGKSALDAVGVARERCWRNDWVVDLDIRGFFDNLDHSLILHAVKKYTDCKMMLTYIERWLKAAAQDARGQVIERDKGTPQGGVISPILANIFMNLAFDQWMKQEHP